MQVLLSCPCDRLAETDGCLQYRGEVEHEGSKVDSMGVQRRHRHGQLWRRGRGRAGEVPGAQSRSSRCQGAFAATGTSTST